MKGKNDVLRFPSILFFADSYSHRPQEVSPRSKSIHGPDSRRLARRWPPGPAAHSACAVVAPTTSPTHTPFATPTSPPASSHWCRQWRMVPRRAGPEPTRQRRNYRPRDIWGLGRRTFFRTWPCPSAAPLCPSGSVSPSPTRSPPPTQNPLATSIGEGQGGSRSGRPPPSQALLPPAPLWFHGGGPSRTPCDGHLQAYLAAAPAVLDCPPRPCFGGTCCGRVL